MIHYIVELDGCKLRSFSESSKRTAVFVSIKNVDESVEEK